MYDIWFCPTYPIEAIKSSTNTDRTGREKLRAALAEDIRENGLVNPIVVLNHRDKGYTDHYCMQGLNRLEAMKILEWSHVPCIVTGECEHEPKVRVNPEDLQAYFPDGTVIFGHHGPKLIDTVPPETYEYPRSQSKRYHKSG